MFEPGCLVVNDLWMKSTTFPKYMIQSIQRWIWQEVMMYSIWMPSHWIHLKNNSNREIKPVQMHHKRCSNNHISICHGTFPLRSVFLWFPIDFSLHGKVPAVCCFRVCLLFRVSWSEPEDNSTLIKHGNSKRYVEFSLKGIVHLQIKFCIHLFIQCNFRPVWLTYRLTSQKPTEIDI